MATQQRCPKCNELNELDAARCAYCNAPLQQTCPRCGTTRPWYATRCPRCDTGAADEASFTNLFHEAPTHKLQGRYVVRETLATSRVSAVYRAVDRGRAAAGSTEADTSVAIKELSTVALFRAEEKRDADQAFRSAVQLWSTVQHPTLARVLDSFVERGKYYVVFDYVPGWNLRRIIEEKRVRVMPELARNWGAQLADLGAALHAQPPPLYWPFLSPNHVMVTAEGRIKLVDLGLTALFSPNNYGLYGSTQGYAAPELASAPPTVTSDIFSLGRLLYALLTGYLLEKGLPRQMTLRQAAPGISAQLVRVVAKAAHRDPQARYESMRELGRALWDEMDGPLQPIGDWLQRPEAAPRAPRPALAPRRTPHSARAAESMTDLGFERDARFGPAAEPQMPVEEERPEPPTIPGQAKLSLYPRTFGIKDLKPGEAQRLVLTLRNVGLTDLDARVTSHVAAVTAPSKTISLPPGKQARVLLSLRAAALPAGRTVEPQAISVASDAGRQWVGLEVDIATGPLLHIEEPAHDLGIVTNEMEQTWTLVLANAGRQVLTAHVSSRVPWLRAPQGEIRCAGQSTVRAPITFIPTRLPPGEQRVAGALLVDSDGGQAQIEVCAWRRKADLDVGASHMDLGAALAGEIVERFLYIRNKGDGTLEGTARALLPWLRVEPQQFSCAPGEMAQLTVAADTVGLADGLIETPQALRVQSNGGNQTLSLRLQVRAPKLVLGAAQLAFGTVPIGEARELWLAVRNEGTAPLDCAVQALAPWLQASLAAIHVEPGSAAELVVRADTSAFQQGQQIDLSQALRIVCASQVAELPASITVLRPALRVEPQEIDFGYIDRSQPETRQFLVANEGTGRLAWNVQSDVLWSEITPRAGVCEAGEAATVTLTAYGLALEGESAAGVLVVNSDGGRAKVPLRVALAAPNLAIDTTLLDLGSSVNLASVSGSFRIFNYGLGMLRGTISADRTWLVVDRASFEVATGRSVEVRVSTDMDEFPAGQSYAGTRISVMSNGGNAALEVALNIDLAPQIEPTPSPLALRVGKANTLEGHLVLHNRGMAAGHVELRPSHPALRLSRVVCDVKPGKSVRVAVEWSPSDAQPEEGLYVDVVYGTERLRVPVETAQGLEASAPISQPEKESRR